MATFDLYNVKKEKVGSIELSDSVFGAKPNPEIIWEMVNYQRNKARSGSAHTKTKSEVAGTGKKPFKQKGTGMARQGSLRNPHQRGGGVAHGPRAHSFATDIPKKKRVVALRAMLSTKAREGQLWILDAFKVDKIKTKNAVKILEKLGVKKPLVVDVDNSNLQLSVRNVAGAQYLPVNGVNVYDLLKHPSLILTQTSAKALDERLQP